MAQERPVTPEKQLLSLIETSSSKNAAIQAHAARRHGMSLVSHGAWMGRISFFKDNLKKYLTDGHIQLDVKLLNRALIAIIVLLAAYLFTSIYFGAASLARLPALKLTVEGARDHGAVSQKRSVLKNAMSYYIEKIRERDIFKIGKTTLPPKESAQKEPTPKIIEETQRLKLVGISWSKDPDAMIEDTAALRTFFVKRGQMLGRVKVEAIFKDKVVLSFEGEETELR